MACSDTMGVLPSPKTEKEKETDILINIVHKLNEKELRNLIGFCKVRLGQL